MYVLDELTSFGYYLKCSKNALKLKQASDVLSRPGDCGADMFIVQDTNFQRDTPVQNMSPQLSGQVSAIYSLVFFFIALLLVVLFRSKMKLWLRRK